MIDSVSLFVTMTGPSQPSGDPMAPVATTALDDLRGSILEERYELGSILGAGGMGAVFEATHLRLDRKVAIKVLRPVFAGHDQYIRRFLREAKAASKIRHRNVVEILDYGEASGGLVYSVMEFLVGRDLEQLLRTSPEYRLPWPQACPLLVQIASGLKAAHGSGVIHRDIKPANCFLTEEDGDPLIKLVDFGIAKVDDSEQTHQLTGTAQLLGTPSYIAPELVRTKEAATAQSDMYSLGVVAYRLLTGAVPFSGDTTFEVLRQACFEPVPSMRERVPQLPPEVEAFVGTLLAKDPNDRPHDMLAVRDGLSELAQRTAGPIPIELAASTSMSVPVNTSIDRGQVRTEQTTTPHDLASPHALQSPNGSPAGGHAPVTAVALQPLPPLEPGPGSGIPAVIVNQQSAAMFSHGTTPSVGEYTPPPDSISLDQPPRRAGVWLGLGAIVALGIVGVLVWPSLSEPPPDVPPASTAAAVTVEAPPVTPTSPGPEDAPPSTTPTTPDDAGHAAAPSGPDVPPSSPSQAPTADAVPTAGSPPANEPATKPKPTQPTATNGSSSTRKPKPTAKPKPKGPPSDATLLAKIKRQIKSKCGPLPAGGIAVQFAIGKKGQPMSLISTRGTAGTCALKQIKGTSFRPRSNMKPVNFTVK